MIRTIHEQTGQSVRRIAQTLGVPRSSYYHAAEPTPMELADKELGARIASIFRTHRRRYGYRRIWKELQAQGHPCAPDRVRRLMREGALHALQPRTFVPRTSDGRADAPSPNLLAGQPLPERPNEVWAGDICQRLSESGWLSPLRFGSFIPTANGWLYLAVIIDLCSRRIVGWALGDHLRADLVVGALRQALAARGHTRGLIFHSDRGSQYGSKAYRALLRSAGLRQSMSARANPYHNAWSEPTAGR
jgi:putative transposase